MESPGGTQLGNQAVASSPRAEFIKQLKAKAMLDGAADNSDGGARLESRSIHLTESRLAPPAAANNGQPTKTDDNAGPTANASSDLDPTKSPYVPRKKSHLLQFAPGTNGSSASGLRQPVGRLPGSQSVPNLVGSPVGFATLQDCISNHQAQAQKQQHIQQHVENQQQQDHSPQHQRQVEQQQTSQMVSPQHQNQHQYATRAVLPPQFDVQSNISYGDSNSMLSVASQNHSTSPEPRAVQGNGNSNGNGHYQAQPSYPTYAVAPLAYNGAGTVDIQQPSGPFLSSNGQVNGQANSQGNDYTGGYANGYANGNANGHVNGGHSALTVPSGPAYNGTMGAPNMDLIPAIVPTPRPLVDVVPEHIRSQRSALLNSLTSGPNGRPTVTKALDAAYFPFVESARASPELCTYGVVKFKNIPFATRRSEIIAFLGRNSKILNDNLEPVHIIMERVTSKTMDAYVEFLTLQDAMKAVDRHQQTQVKGRLTRLGDRPVEVELSSQGSLMADLFPLANGVFWEGTRPTLKAFNPDEPWNNFKGFITEEEMTMLIKHVEVPQRSPFSRDCPQRPFECMISTLRKLPWHMADLISIRQRHAIYRACRELIKLLTSAIAHGRSEDLLNEQLRRRLLHAAMTCPGFTVVQKDDVATLAGMNDAKKLEYGLPRHAGSWLHLYALSPKPNMPLDVIEYYVAILREESTRAANSLPLNERALVTNYAADTDPYFGFLWWELQFPRGEEFDNMTLAAAALQELTVIERILIRAFAAAS